MNKLGKDDVKTFYKLQSSLFYFANSKLNTIKNVHSREHFFKRDIQESIPLRKKLYSSPHLFSEYAKENPDNFSKDELDIVESWKKNIAGKFFIFKYEPEYAVLFHPDSGKAYGVLALLDSFEEILGDYLPIVAEMTILPFREKLVYDGIVMPYNISFGGGFRKSLKVDVETAIHKNGIITSLEGDGPQKQVSEEETLRFYLKSQDTRDRYWKEIEKLRKKSSSLEAIYHQEQGRILSKEIRKKLKDLGITGWFAIIDDCVIASAKSEKEFEDALSKILPKEKENWIYILKM